MPGCALAVGSLLLASRPRRGTSPCHQPSRGPSCRGRGAGSVSWVGLCVLGAQALVPYHLVPRHAARQLLSNLPSNTCLLA